VTQKYQFIATHAEEYPVTVVCRVLGLARSGYYAWKRRVPSARARRDLLLTEQIQTSFTASRRTYGSPRVHAELRAQDVRCGRKRVARLMREAKLVARTRRRRTPCTTDSRHGLGVAPNVLDRQFTVERPNQAWVSDITYLPTREGWLYLAVVLDLYARRVVGWSMQPTLERKLVLAALADAIGRRRPPAGVLHHSDRGSQYASGEYQALLAKHGIGASMSRKGNCWDNAAMESFFATLKGELPQTEFASHQAGRSAVFDYIERFYNRQRRHSTLNYQTPLAYEQEYATCHAE
jgi:transposase InsO family protein